MSCVCFDHGLIPADFQIMYAARKSPDKITTHVRKKMFISIEISSEGSRLITMNIVTYIVT